MIEKNTDKWEVDLTVDLGKLKLKNPLFSASGTFGYGDELKGIINPDELGAICTKSITPKAREGNPAPRIAELDYGMLNSIGLANVGLRSFIADKMPYLAELSTNVIVNVAGFSIDDYLEVVIALESEKGIDGYEINISCPNVDGGLEFGSSAKSAEELTKRIRKETERFLMVKLSPNVTDISEIAKAVEGAGADSISLINTLVGMEVDINSELPLLQRKKGGYSGPGIKPVALAMVNSVYQNVKIPVVGIGGIMNASDVVQFMLVGATAVQLGTTNFINPESFSDILDDLINIAESKGLRNISDLTGRLKEWE
ncbi:MAG: dihydroorotate dehydrogenase [Candidatus Marinimicrobia bacterium]|nr:dihydroorotate dehydrogenase [Candidatus Neomarinimicrobiota bacterium]